MAITVTKILVDKWFYVYGIPACIHSNKGCSFDNEIMSHKYGMYGVKQSTTMPYSPCENAPTARLNPYTNWPAQITIPGAEEQLAVTSTITGICISAMPHDTTGYQPYELMFWLQGTNYL